VLSSYFPDRIRKINKITDFWGTEESSRLRTARITNKKKRKKKKKKKKKKNGEPGGAKYFLF